MTWDPTNPPAGWRFNDIAGAWQRRNDRGRWELAEPPAEAFVSSRECERSERSEERSPREGPSSSDSLSSHMEEAGAPWPDLDPAAFHGLAGEVVRTLKPHTEADPAGLLACFLTAFGNTVGPHPRALADAAAHPARLNVVLVGDTARARKGTAQANVDRIMQLAEPEWFSERVMGGLAYGEGLIAAVHDPAEDEPATDRRLLVVEPEFARVLAVAGREGSTLSAILRQAWDKGELRVMTRRDPLRATGAHVSVIGHITVEELRRRLTDVEQGNGFANRFLFCCVRRSQLLPHGGNLDPAAIDHLAGRVAAAAARARPLGMLRRSTKADELWERAYREFADAPSGLAATVTARPEAQTLRLSVSYALLDGSPVIEVEHLEAALAVWRYCEASAAYVFGTALGDEIADRLLAAIRAAGADGLDTTAQHRVFGGHLPTARLAHARAELEARDLIVTTQEETAGRPRLVSRAVTR